MFVEQLRSEMMDHEKRKRNEYERGTGSRDKEEAS